MNRKARQHAERTMREAGAMTISWDHGQKHEIATVRTGSGHLFDIVFARGYTDDKVIRRTALKRMREGTQGMPVIK